MISTCVITYPCCIAFLSLVRSSMVNPGSFVRSAHTTYFKCLVSRANYFRRVTGLGVGVHLI